MKKNEATSFLLKITEKALRKKVKDEYSGWPPYCNGIFHQPKRPKRVIKED